jgi:protein SCO1
MEKKFVITIGTTALFLVLVAACVKEKPLPIYGERDFNGIDTVYHTVPEFKLLNQDSSWITNENLKGKIYVADFFFTKCPTICPIMKTQMLRVYDRFKNDPEVVIVSHTIDPEYDTVAVLRDYANRLGVESNKWNFLTGSMDDIYDLAKKGYFVTATVDKTEAGGFLHSGAFMLIDQQQRIRGQYDGTKDDQVDRLMKDIERLKNELK